ncbi:hypothetical protein BpHYR1_043743 [Brachionus plicatilis]|uniref:Uncharacterized protein n=1 Tax=Brachionus plicatilis TaxID=10195 RepID=A0A3M7SQM3_BRAPC|nr:hypothetical protein BpHYR1_043743 [Brachionus plicatilis]
MFKLDKRDWRPCWLLVCSRLARLSRAFSIRPVIKHLMRSQSSLSMNQIPNISVILKLGIGAEYVKYKKTFKKKWYFNSVRWCELMIQNEMQLYEAKIKILCANRPINFFPVYFLKTKLQSTLSLPNYVKKNKN